jgi:hypothetical protein
MTTYTYPAATATVDLAAGKVAAMASNGFVSVRNGSARVVAALTAVIPGKGGQRAAGAVIGFYPSYAAARDAADAVTNGHDTSDPASWSDGRWTVAVPAYAVDGRSDTPAAKAVDAVALWLAAADLHNYLTAAAAHDAAQVAPTAPRGRRSR